MRSSSHSQGFGVIEIVVAAAIITLIATAAGASWQLYLRVAAAGAGRTQAAILTEEASEALQIIRDTAWTGSFDTITLGTPYDIVWNGSAYSLSTPAPIIQGRFTREIVFSSVLRDGAKDIAVSGTNDPNTRKATMTIYAIPGANTSTTTILQSEMLIHNIYAN